MNMKYLKLFEEHSELDYLNMLNPDSKTEKLLKWANRLLPLESDKSIFTLDYDKVERKDKDSGEVGFIKLDYPNLNWLQNIQDGMTEEESSRDMLRDY